MVFKSLNDLAPDDLKSMFTDRNAISTYSLRNCEGKLAVPMIYIDDFTNRSSIFDFHLFADDSNLFYTHGDLQHLEQNVNRELSEISLWLCANKLSLNITKTHFVVFHPIQKEITNSLNIEIDGKPINQQKSVKYLGILIDCHLNWKEQIQQISKKKYLRVLVSYLRLDILLIRKH